MGVVMRWTEGQYQEYLHRTKTVSNIIPTRNKYNNKKTVVDGITFDSKKEADYYIQLKVLKQMNKIRDFKMQQKYILQEGFEKDGVKHRPITYIADFVILHWGGGIEVIDIKPSKQYQTQVYKLKKKLFEYKHPELKIKEVY